LKQCERKKLINKYTNKGVKFQYLIKDVDGRNDFYCLNSGTDCEETWVEKLSFSMTSTNSRHDYKEISYYETSSNVMLQTFLKAAAQEQWDYFRDEVDKKEGADADITYTRYYFGEQEIEATQAENHFFKGRIGELIMFSDELSNDEVTEIRKKLIEKWK
ncbi:MAG: hypothetical protein VX699_11675, partial [Myxococcota bacterium]|nr:hypothetical protein [Myxococcota bacterium]